MKKIVLLILLISFFKKQEAQNFSWAQKGGLWAYDYGNGIVNDNYGNVYVSGKYEMNAIFSGVTLPCQGNHDVFLAKYNSAGALTWIRTAGGPSGDYAHAIAYDGGNNIYIAGEIEGTGTTIKFIGSSATLTCKGSNDIMFAKYDLSGNLIWARRAGGYNNEKALGITTDANGNVYICGFFIGSATFGSTTVYGFGKEDIFIAKYDANGNFIWVKTAGSSERDEAKSIKCDAAGNVYICGMYRNNCNFGSQTLTAQSVYFDAFVAKYSSSGVLLWLKKGGGTYDDVAWSMAMDGYGKIYITGEFNATANFSGISIYTHGNADVFVACYDSNGNIQWITKAGGQLIDRARGIAFAGTKIYITGQFGATAYFGSSSVTAADSSDIFIASLTNTGSFLWCRSVGGSKDAYESLGYESGNAICAESNGNVYATGSTLNGGVFGNTALGPYSRTDIFVAKIVSGKSEEEQQPPAVNSNEAELLNSEMAMKVFPNPNIDHTIFFQFDGISENAAEITIEIFDAAGKNVFSKELSFINGVSDPFAPADVPPGIYIVKASLKNRKPAFQKLIIQ